MPLEIAKGLGAPNGQQDDRQYMLIEADSPIDICAPSNGGYTSTENGVIGLPILAKDSRSKKSLTA